MIVEGFDNKFISKVSKWNQCWVHIVVDQLLHNQIRRHLQIRLNASVLESVHKVDLRILRWRTF